MNKLSEEEIIEECNKLFVTMEFVHIDGKAMADLLDLYKQEKEKNKNCKKQEYTVGRLDERKAWQYKIKAKIEKLEAVINEFYNSGGNLTISDEFQYKIDVLQELLEEN